MCSTPHRLYYEGAVPIQGHKETIKALKSGRYAQLTEKLTGQKVISDHFGEKHNCGFYLTVRPLYSPSFGMIFQVCFDHH